MKSLFLAGLKGGTTKSSSSILIGLHLAKKHRVAIIDLDQNASVYHWGDDRNSINIEPGDNRYMSFKQCIKHQVYPRDVKLLQYTGETLPHTHTQNLTVIHLNAKAIPFRSKNQIGPSLVACKAPKYDYIIIDGPANDLELTMALAPMVDRVLIPTGTSNKDVREAISLIEELIKAKISTDKMAVMLGKIKTEASARQTFLNVQKMLAETNVRLLNQAIQDKQSFASAFDLGFGPQEIHYPKLREEAEKTATAIETFLEG